MPIDSIDVIILLLFWLYNKIADVDKQLRFFYVVFSLMKIGTKKKQSNNNNPTI